MIGLDNLFGNFERLVHWYVADDDWQYVVLESSIWEESTQTSLTRVVDGFAIVNDKSPPFDLGIVCSRSLVCFRDEHLGTTGRRIWGLTFTLYPDGTYHIEYDYQKPADYEDDPDDTIDGDEINQRLQQLQAPTAVMPAEQVYQQIGYCLLQGAVASGQHITGCGQLLNALACRIRMAISPEQAPRFAQQNPLQDNSLQSKTWIYCKISTDSLVYSVRMRSLSII
ncbi:hypothetical protein [Vogesella mureinivorans]|uniref:hypothetical protein n=1 Tax=Vogesella mureinivorans TaxID=657276 RepID=UPI0011CBEA98|nr:hypothetical protein [Vogesella mureinivorans]